MVRLFLLVSIFVMILAFSVTAQEQFEKDVIKTSTGDLEITFIGHATIVFTFGGKVIHVDPVSRYGDYSGLPKADMILITHEHGDHLDPELIKSLRTEKTALVLTESCTKKVKGGTVMKNGDVQTIEGLKVEAVPAYRRL